MSEVAENWCPVTIWPNVGRGVCPSFPKKIWAGLLWMPLQKYGTNQIMIIANMTQPHHVFADGEQPTAPMKY